jgi:L-alanine-DL-glutamate epimerase-like enolase superfamily enzyme
MKITAVCSTVVAVPLTSRPVESRLHEGPRDLASIIVEVHTDEGLVGLGEAAPVLGPDLTPAILNSAAEFLVGENPLHVNRLMKTLYARYNLTHLHPHAANWALNAIEMALWDLTGKSAGLPLYELWGGPFRLDIKYYGDIERQDPGAMEADAKRLIAAGFDTLYTKVGLDPDDDLAAVAAMRAGAGSDRVKIRVDANQSWSPGEAITMIRAMAAYGLEFVDQPVLMFNLEALHRVRDAVPVPIAAHESGWTMYEALNVLKHDAADILHVDPRFDAGLTGARVTAGMAEAAGLPVVLHSFGELGVAFAAGMHLIASCPNFTLANQEAGYRRLTDDVIAGGLMPFEGATVRVPDGPGLGVALDPDRVARYAEYYQRDIRERGRDRDLNTTIYKAMYMRSYLREDTRALKGG